MMVLAKISLFCYGLWKIFKIFSDSISYEQDCEDHYTFYYLKDVWLRLSLFPPARERILIRFSLAMHTWYLHSITKNTQVLKFEHLYLINIVYQELKDYAFGTSIFRDKLITEYFLKGIKKNPVPLHFGLSTDENAVNN